jgi:PhnB protein
MKLTPYLNYGGNCKEAFLFYEKHLGGKITMMMTHGDIPGPNQTKPEWMDAILYAEMEIGGTQLKANDIPGNAPMRSAYLCLSLGSIEEAEKIYTLLSENGEIFMPMAETFFAHRFSMLRDRFGTSWMLIHEKPMSGN